MLEATLNTRFIIGSNLSGGLAGADWRYLLPRLRFESVLCFEVPTMASLPVLETLGRAVFVVSRNLASLRKVSAGIANSKTGNIQAVCIDDLSKLPFADRSIDLIFLRKKQGQNGGLAGIKEVELRRVLKSDGLVYYEKHGRGDKLAGEMKRLGTHRKYWITPFSGKMRTAVPLQDKATGDYFFAKVLYGQSWKKRAMSKVGRLLNGCGLISTAMPRRATVIQRDEASGTDGLPKYVQSLAEKAGMKLQGCRFGLSTRGLGNSNKAIFFLFKDADRKPEAVIKITRAKEFNYRLENEYQMLSRLKEKALVKAETIPEPLFLDYHNELAVMGMRAVEGDPFRKRTQADEHCPIASDAVQWLVELGANSADHNAASSTEVVLALWDLFERFTEIYNLPGQYTDFLKDQLAVLESAQEDVPLVLQHGDPGTWNMLVSEEGKVIVIDWESGEAQGMPLWDLFYFFRTYASWVSRMKGSRDSLKNFSNEFLEPTPLAAILQDVTERYCEATGLESKFIQPLFYTCWMHRALKESMRLTRETLTSGNYVNVLKIAIDHRESPTLQRLFAANSNSHPIKRHQKVCVDEH
ncbi:phosphotransferase [bacterium]|nr:phosphotransferase [bacterium]